MTGPITPSTPQGITAQERRPTVGHRTRRTIGSVATAAVAAGLMVGVPSSAMADEHTTTINLLNINDFHGRIDANTVRFAGTVERERAAYGDDSTLFLSAGDNIGASLFASSVQQDEPTMDVLNALELGATAAGNHEFDTGYPDLVDRIAPYSEFPILGANVYDAGTTDPALPEYELFDVEGLTIGVIGVVTAETPALVIPGGIAMLDFGDPVEAVNRVAAQLTDGDDENGEADVIVAQYHEGANVSSSLAAAVDASPVFASIVNGTDPAVDVIFTGHTHATYVFDAPVPGGEGTRPIVQTGSYGANLGQVVIEVTEDGTVVEYEARNIPRIPVPTGQEPEDVDAELVATYPRVAEVAGIVEAALEYADEVGSVVIGEITADITTAFYDGEYVDGVYVVSDDPEELAESRDDRASASTLGNLVANVLRDTVSPVGETAEIGVVNPGGLRAELYYDEDGEVTVADANAVLPFVNNVWFTTLTGAQLVTLLNQQWQRDGAGNVPSRDYLQLGLSDNVSYVADPTRAEGDRIVSVHVDGEPVDPTGEYRISSFSFLVQGGDNFHVFRDGADTVDTGLVDRDVWISFFEEAGPVSPDFAKQFMEVQGVESLTGGLRTGDRVELTVSGANLTSLGSPFNTELEVWLGDTQIGTAPFDADGVAAVSVAVPSGLPAGATDLVLVAQPSGTTVAVPVTVGARQFSDVGPGHPFYTPIMWASEAGIARGYADGTFQPSRRISRQAMAAFVHRVVVGPDASAPACTAAPFLDVPVDHPFCAEIAWMSDNGLTTGYADGTYRPSAGTSRQATAAFLYRLTDDVDAPTCARVPFTDVPVGHPFCAEIAWAADAGITEGYPDGTFRPSRPVSRQAMAAFLYRMVGEEG